jgi:hypothetical protein
MRSFMIMNIIWVTKSRRMRQAVHVVHMEDRKNAYRFWWGDLRKRDNWKDFGTSEHSNESSATIKCGEFLKFSNFFNAHLPVT